MAEEEYGDDAGGGAPEALIAGDEKHVDDSQLKIAAFDASQFSGRLSTGEENDEVLFQSRAKLFAFVDGAWKERALGDVKLSRDRESGKVRFVMRQEKVLKVRANHFVNPDVALSAMAGSDVAFTWSALDYSDDEPKTFLFSIKFNKENAPQFRTAYDAARDTNRGKLTKGGAGASPAKASGGAAAAAPAAAAAAVDKSGPIPVVESLDAIYGAGDADAQAARYGALTAAFRSAYDGAEPTVYVRAPGRVNLIGEHIDYHGYSVLPMALGTQDVVIAVGTPEGGPSAGVRVANANPKYAAATLPSDPAAPVGYEAGVTWDKYVHCGYKGAWDVARARGLVAPGTEPGGLRFVVDGSVPAGAGVSSSSALVVASLLATLRAYGWDTHLSRAELGEAGRACELYIGTMSGGMDQAASAMGASAFALRIDFEPLVATPVPLPPRAVFVVSNTLEESPKAVDSEKRYNKRVTEGKLAAKLVAKALGVPSWRGITTFRHLQETMHLPSPGALLPAIEQHLKVGAYSIADAEAASGVAPLGGLFDGDNKRVGALKVLASVGQTDPAFDLLKRARHVCSEADRVFQLEDACKGKGIEGGVGSPTQLKAMGELLTASHASCRDDYECSSPGLDELTVLALASGAFGSRLTGAGWGGCAVSLVDRDALPAFLAAMRKGYYDARLGAGADTSAALFASPPGSGAAVYTPVANDL